MRVVHYREKVVADISKYALRIAKSISILYDFD